MGETQRGAPMASRATSRVSLLSLLAACALALESGSLAAELFGQHFPQGSEAVAYLYGPNGTWREQTGTQYGWNFYKHCETPAHKHDPHAMLMVSAASNSTAPDANCVLLGDFNNDGEVDDETISGHAFHEHSGRGLLGEQTSAPFYQFWFDDNWVARYMAEAYDRAHPAGLHDRGHAVRWRLLAGDNRHWRPYPSSSPHVDQIALNGLYKVNAGNLAGALADWRAVRNASGAVYDATRKRYTYSFAAKSIYYYGLWAILSERLLATPFQFRERGEMLQHAMSVRSSLLALQERDAQGNRLGWRTGTVPEALINTETTALAVLALGAQATWVLEPGDGPLLSKLKPAADEDVLSAVAGQAQPGTVVFGPHWTLAPGSYDVEFSLRTSAKRIDTPLVTLDVYDGNSVRAVAVIDGATAPVGDQWRRYRLNADIVDATNLTEFRVYWHGANDVDIGPVRVTRVATLATANGAKPSPIHKAAQRLGIGRMRDTRSTFKR